MNFTDFEGIVEAVPQLRRGSVWCTKCGLQIHVNSAHCLKAGWPKCCGYTMTIDSPAERAASARTSGAVK